MNRQFGKKRGFFISDFICKTCGINFPLPRIKQRKKNYIKTFYCYSCKEISNFKF